VATLTLGCHAPRVAHLLNPVTNFLSMLSNLLFTYITSVNY